MNHKLLTQLRIVGAIATKDIVDAIKNRTTLFNILFVFLMLLAYRWLMPVMFGDDDLVVYDAGSSRLVEALGSSTQFSLRPVASLQELQGAMAEDPRGELGLAIPADFDRRLDVPAANGTAEPALSGYLMWSSRSTADDLQADLERRLSALIAQPVRIQVSGTVQPQPDAMGPFRLVAAAFVLSTIFMGALTVPHLMFEEKRTRTLDALLVSPASIGQVVLGKALAGLFFCLTALLVAFVFNWAFVTHWGVMLLAVGSGTLLAVGFGLLLGTFLDNREQMMVWALIPGQLLLGPVFISVFDVILPKTVRTVMYCIPTVALTRLFHFSFSNGARLTEVLFYGAIVALTAIALLLTVVWKVRRSDR